VVAVIKFRVGESRRIYDSQNCITSERSQINRVPSNSPTEATIVGGPTHRLNLVTNCHRPAGSPR